MKPETRPDLPNKPIETPRPIAPTQISVDHTIIINSIGMKLHLIPEGEFKMGSTDSEPDSQADEKPQHKVKITRPFFLGVFEVTQAEYKTVVGSNPSQFSPSGESKARLAGMSTDRFPVDYVSWFDAVAFCNKLSDREGLKPCYTADEKPIASGTGYRLPTEVEWEYSCRAGTTTSFSFGGTITPNEANFDGNYTYNGSLKGTYLERTTTVGSNPPNAFGLYDMHGNVWEWCADWYDASYYMNSPGADPDNRTKGMYRVLRGGSWGDFPQKCRSAYRFKRTPGSRNFSMGFRVARVQ